MFEILIFWITNNFDDKVDKFLIDTTTQYFSYRSFARLKKNVWLDLRVKLKRQHTEVYHRADKKVVEAEN